MLTLKSLIAEALLNGWATGSGKIEFLQWQMDQVGATSIPIRTGQEPIALLKPVAKADAHPNSLSAIYGTGSQPLHTDGAHLPEPPDIVILACESTSNVATRLWKTPGSFIKPPPIYVHHGIFAVLAGRDSFYSTAYPDRRYRFDPGCMVPCDQRARQAVTYFSGLEAEAVEHHWSEPDLVLAIDNKRVLHARSSAEDEPNRQIKRLAMRLPKDS